jgi:tRNA threonylcarbamoyladenosine biosynthesis protein TsaB
VIFLALETSTRLGSVALVDDRRGLVAESRFSLSIAHSESLMPGVAQLLEQTGLSMTGLDGIALAIGPGSFTGLRVALTTAKGLAFASGLPLYPVSTLMAMAWPLRFSAIAVCPMLEARKNEIYAALYRPALGRLETVIPECAPPPEDFFSRIAEPVLFLGDASARFRDRLVDVLGARTHFAPMTLAQPGAVSVAELAFETYRDKPAPDPISLIPNYLRPCEAELKWQALHPSSSSP